MKPGKAGRTTPGPEQVRKVARELCASALAWGKTLFACVAGLEAAPVPPGNSMGPSAELENELFAEVLAYGFCRLQMRMDGTNSTGSEQWLRLVKQECEALKGARAWRRRNRHQRLGGAVNPESTALSRESFQAEPDDATGASPLTREMFEQFCLTTGLGSSVLVGKGENLAALVFYIALHGVWSAHRPLTREQVLCLLRAAQECRRYLDRRLACWFAPPESPQNRLA